MKQHDLLGIDSFSGQNGLEYRDQTYGVLYDIFEPEIDEVMSILASRDLVFPAMNSVHLLQLRRPLIARHCLPFLLTHYAFFPSEKPKIDVLAACISAHTLALTHLDYHLDGAAPAEDNEVSAVKVPASSAVSYAVRMVYEAGSIVESPEDLKILFDTVFRPVSGFVVSRMHEDWLARTTPIENEIHCSVEEYLISDRSRILTSGYWEVMIRAAFIGRDIEIPDDIISFCRSLRVLRQLVDELFDIEEDTYAGVVTLPGLVAQEIHPEMSETIDLLCRGELGDDDVSRLVSLLRSKEITEICSEKIMSCYREGTFMLASISSEKRHLLQLLLDLKIAKFDILQSSMKDASRKNAAA